MNLPYYFLRDLNKMTMNIQENTKTLPHGIYHHGLIKVLIKADLGKTHKTWGQFLIHSGFKKEVHPPALQSHDKVVVTTQEDSPSSSQPTFSKKDKREARLKTSDELVKSTPTSQQED